MESTTSDYDKEKLQERLAKLAGGVAVLYVGAASEVEMKEKKDRVDDALHATKAALQEGIVAGGGAALLHARKKLNKEYETTDLELGRQIVRKACLAPFTKILTNAGYEEVNTWMLINDINKSESTDGYDLKSKLNKDQLSKLSKKEKKQMYNPNTYIELNIENSVNYGLDTEK